MVLMKGNCGLSTGRQTVDDVWKRTLETLETFPDLCPWSPLQLQATYRTAGKSNCSVMLQNTSMTGWITVMILNDR